MQWSNGSVSVPSLKYNHHLRTNDHNRHYCTAPLPSLPHLLSQHRYNCHHYHNHHKILPPLQTQLLLPPFPSLKLLPPVSPLQPQPLHELLPQTPLSSDITATVELLLPTLPPFTQHSPLNYFLACTSITLLPYCTNNAKFATSNTTNINRCQLCLHCFCRYHSYHSTAISAYGRLIVTTDSASTTVPAATSTSYHCHPCKLI